MAKKKSANDGDSKPVAKTSTIDDIIEKYGNVVQEGLTIANTKQIVVPVSPAIDIALGGGIPEGSFNILCGPQKGGKEQPLDAKILTPSGWKLMGDIKINDRVCTPFGRSTIVTGVFPQGIKDVYRVTFCDDSHTECGLDHLWKVSNDHEQLSNFKILSTRDLLNHSNLQSWYTIPSVCEFDSCEKVIHPYILGVLLGDGGLTVNVHLTNSSKEVVDRVNSLLDNGYYFKQKEGSDIEYNLNSNRELNKYRIELEKLGLMYKLSKDKFIPSNYIYSASIEERQELLKGLMDTDGFIAKNGSTKFYTTSYQLASDVCDLIKSLGGISKIYIKKGKYKNEVHLSYAVSVRLSSKKNLFHKPEKIARTVITGRHLPRKSIKNIELVGKKECQCISVLDPEHMYVTDDFIATHNTLLALWIAANAQQNYDPVLCPNGRNIYFFGIEGRLKPRDLQGIPHLDLSKFHQIVSEPGNILTAEKSLDAADMAIRSDPGCIVIIDSFSQLCTQAEMIAGMDEMQRADGPKLLAKFCRKVANVIPINKVILIGITHVMSNVTGYGAKYQEKSGNAIQYQADVKLRILNFEYIRPSEDANPTGQQVEWKVEYCAIGPPGAKATSYIKYGTGIDSARELAGLGEDLGIIEKSGSWYSFANTADYTDKKIQGMDNIVEFLENDKIILEKLRKEVYTICGLPT